MSASIPQAIAALCEDARRTYSMYPLMACLKMRAPKFFNMIDVRPVLTPSLHSSWAPIFPQTLNTIPYTPLLSDDRPHENIFGASYGQGFPAPAIPPVQALEALPKVIEAAEAERPAKRQRLLAAASARDGTKVEGPAPASTQRKTRLHIKTSGRSIGRAFHACARCR